MYNEYTLRRKDEYTMTFEELFLTLKDYFAGKDFKDFGKGDYSYEFNVTGEGEGKFYLEVKDGSPDIQPFDYKNCLCSFTVRSGNLRRIVSGIPINSFCEMRGHFNHQASMNAIAESVKNSAYEIINRKGATYYGIAMSVKRICEAIVRDEKSILPVSCIQHDNYGISDIALSMPAIVGRDGVEGTVPIELSGQEALALRVSADTLKDVIDSVF